MIRKRKKYHFVSTSINGFTLLEIVVAIAIFAVVISLIYPAYTGTYRYINAAESQAEIYQMARITLDRIIDDLESANIPDPSESNAFTGKDDFVGESNSDSLRFISRSHISFGDEHADSGNAKISYYVREN
jgi:general secretion pathway protein J